MLSQSRKKLKWSQDPQNTFWSNTTNTFGHKMLQKMGWKKGKGLGINEDGNAEPIKLNANKTKQGLGCTGYDDTWLAHQDDFSAVLSELNDVAGKEDYSTEAKSKVVSLEETSKRQKRLHYKKFTKGKDLSSYNQSDMHAIFGLKPQSLPSTPCAGSDDGNCLSQQNDKKPYENTSVSTPSLTTLIPADCNVTDYFRMKLEKLKQQKTQNLTDCNGATNSSDNCALSINDCIKDTRSQHLDDCDLERSCLKLLNENKKIVCSKKEKSESLKRKKRKKKLKNSKAKKKQKL